MAGIISNLIAQLTGFGLGQTEDWLQRRREEDVLKKGYAALGPYLEEIERVGGQRAGILQGGVTPEEAIQLQSRTPVVPYDVYRSPFAPVGQQAYEAANVTDEWVKQEQERYKKGQELLKNIASGVGKYTPQEAWEMFAGDRPLPTGPEYTQTRATAEGEIAGAKAWAGVPAAERKMDYSDILAQNRIRLSGDVQAGLIDKRLRNQKEYALWQKKHGLGPKGKGGGGGDKGFTPSVMRGIFTDATKMARDEVLNDPGVQNEAVQWIAKSKGIAPELRAGYDWETLTEGDKTKALQAIGVEKRIRARRDMLANEMIEIIKAGEFPTEEPTTTETPTTPTAETQEEDPTVRSANDKIQQLKERGWSTAQIRVELKRQEAKGVPIPWKKLRL